MAVLEDPTNAAPTVGHGSVGQASVLAAAASLAALSLAALGVALHFPPILAGGAALAALVAAGAALVGTIGALARPIGRSEAAASAAPLTDPTPSSLPSSLPVARAAAVSDASGGFVSCNEAYRALVASSGASDGFAALIRAPANAAAVFALRRRALTSGAAEGALEDGTLLTITRVHAQHGRQALLHTLDPPSPSPAASPSATDGAARTADGPASVAALLVEVVPAPCAVVATSGLVIAANPAFRDSIGVSTNVSDDVAVDAASLGRLHAQAERRETARLDAALRHGPERRLRLTALPFSEDRLILTAADITAQSDLEAHMAQSQKMQAIGQLAGGIAHDFNNVLTAIIGFSDLLLQNHRPSDPAFRDIMNIKQSAERAAGLVKQLLAFSRRQTLRPTVLNLNDVLADLAVMLDRLLGEPVRLEISYGRDLWPVLADLSQIEQVVINLAVNARDAMPGGGELTIRTRNVPQGTGEQGKDGAIDGDAVLIEVADVGTGMPPHVLEKIFEPFFTTKATGEGTGLGLSTVYGIVKQTGGTLNVTSKEGSGTRFEVVLPRAAMQAPVAEKREPAAAPTDLTGDATVLLVEDEEAIRAFAARALAAKGYTVLTASSGLEAAEMFAERPHDIDLLLTDVIMPELDGPSLVKQVRAIRPDIKVIFMSGYADGASVDDLGGAPFLPKPFALKVLVEAVKRALVASDG